MMSHLCSLTGASTKLKPSHIIPLMHQESPPPEGQPAPQGASTPPLPSPQPRDSPHPELTVAAAMHMLKELEPPQGSTIARASAIAHTRGRTAKASKKAKEGVWLRLKGSC